MTAIIPASSAAPAPIAPARTLDELILNCEKDEPLASGDVRFQDLAEGRGDPVTDLFTVRLRRPDQRYDEFDGPGRDLLERALARRIDLDLLIPEKAVRDRLIGACGGGVRGLLELVAWAGAYAQQGKAPIVREEDAERAISRSKQHLRDQINSKGWWPAVMHVAETKQVSDDNRCMEILFHRLAFKYNGDGWYDIHPLITELKEFKSRL